MLHDRTLGAVCADNGIAAAIMLSMSAGLVRSARPRYALVIRACPITRAAVRAVHEDDGDEAHDWSEADESLLRWVCETNVVSSPWVFC